MGREPLGPLERAQKILKKLFFENFENTYMVSRCRRGDWYILLRNFGKIEQQHVASTPPS